MERAEASSVSSRKRLIQAGIVAASAVAAVTIVLLAGGGPSADGLATAPSVTEPHSAATASRFTAAVHDDGDVKSSASTPRPALRPRATRATASKRLPVRPPSSGSDTPLAGTDLPVETHAVDDLRADVVDEVSKQLDGAVAGVDLDQVTEDVLEQLEVGVSLEDAVESALQLSPALLPSPSGLLGLIP